MRPKDTVRIGDLNLPAHMDPDLKPFVQFSLLGRWGRFGNQLFGYVFARILAEHHKRELRMPEWDGEMLFNLKHLPCINIGEIIREDGCDYTTSGLVGTMTGKHSLRKDADIAGIFQFHTKFYAPYKDKIREWIHPRPEIKRAFDDGLKKYSKGKKIVAIHLRRGDYLDPINHGGMFFPMPVEWALDWLKSFWNPKEHILYIASDSLEYVEHKFAEFEHFSSLGKLLDLENFGFYPDFHALMMADELLISNSSFSFFAAMLNTRCKYSYRATLEMYEGEPIKYTCFDPWYSDVLLHRNLKPSERKEKGLYEL